MCLIMHGPTKKIRGLNLTEAWSSNPHGAGVIIPAMSPRIVKGLMSYSAFKKALFTFPDELNIVVHLRMATHGSVSPQNTHPFEVDKTSYLAHNGILDSLGSSGDKGRSDSAELAEILSYVPRRYRLKMLESIEGKYAYVEGRKVFLIGNFTEENGVSFSNMYWKAMIPRTVYPSPNRFNAMGSWEEIFGNRKRTKFDD